MKKTKMLVLTAMIVLGLGTAVEAKLPANAIVVGNNVYDISYLTSNISKINDAIMNNLNSIFYVDSTSTTKDIFTGATVDDTQIVSKVGNTLNYYTSSGVQKLVADSNNQFDPSKGVTSGDLSAVLTITYKKLAIGNQVLYAYTAAVNQHYGLQDAAYFSLDNSSVVSLTEVNTYVGTSLSSVPRLYIYDTSQKDIASGPITGVVLNSDAGTINVTVSLHYDGTANTQTGTGNSSVNIVNTGFTDIASDNKWMYYVNTADSNKLYRKSVSGAEDSVISDDKVGYINILGDWIYYINYNDGSKIYKVRTDGTQKQKVSNDMVSCLNILSGNIYYINQSDRGRIYVIDSQGTRMICSDSANFLSAGSNNMLYYTNITDSNRLYKYLLTTDTKSKVSDIPVQFLNVLGDSSVLYTGKDGLLYASTGAYNSNPSGMIAVTNVPSGKSSSTTLNALNDKLTVICADEGANDIYYKSYVDGGKLYKLDKRTGNGYKVLDDTADYINIIGDYIYYMKGGKLYYIPKDSDGTVKGTAVVKNKSTLKISKIGTIDTIRTDDLNKINFRDRIPVTMSDNTTVQLVVNWDKTIPKPSKGIYTFTGTILGYGNKVTVAVALDSGVINTDNVTVVNGTGSKDTVTVTGLNQGDIINIYNASSDTKPLKSATAGSNGIATASALNLNSDGGYLYITLTKAGRSEGEKTVYAYSPEAPASFAVDAANDQITGLKSGTTYKVYLETPDSKTGSLPTTPDTSALRATGQANSSGVLSVPGVLSTMTDLKQLRIVATKDSKDSTPSSSMEVGKPTLSGVSVDLNNARLLGTNVNMQYSYAYNNDTTDPNINPNDWASCLAVSTPISMTRSLQVSVKSQANGPYLASDVVTFGLFPDPVITGITDGGAYYIYSNLTAGWPADVNDSNGKITYTAMLYNLTTGASKSISNAANNLIKLSGTNTIDPDSNIQFGDIAASGTNYKLVVTATKKIGSLTGQAKTTVNFAVTSGKPQTVDIAMAEKPGTMKKDLSDNWISIDPSSDALTYYKATPTWNDYPSTSSTAVIQRIPFDASSGRDLSDVSIDTISDKTNSGAKWNNYEKVPFSPNTVITQDGYYKLTVTSKADDNKATTDTVKYFIVDVDRTATLPTVTCTPTGGSETSISNNGTYNKGMSSIKMVDAGESLTTPTLIRDGYGTPFVNASGAVINPTLPGTSSTSGTITLNGTYQLYLNTVNVVNGRPAEISYTFYVDSTQTSGPDVTFSFDDANANKLMGAAPGMEYNAGNGWKNITQLNQKLTDTELNLINSSASIDRIMVRTKATSDQPASSITNIMLQKADKPTGVTFSFTDIVNQNKLMGFKTATMEYSLDGGVNWNSNSDDEDLTSQVSSGSITATNGIKVRTKATGQTKASDPMNINIIQAGATNTTFSFDGTNAGKLMGFDCTTMEYSLDGGVNWINDGNTPGLANNPDLTSQMPNNAATNDIKVRYKASGTAGSGTIQTIDILDGPTTALTGLSVSGGTLTGTTTAMEYSYSSDGNTGWTSCAAGSTTLNSTLSTGESVYVRTKATGSTLAGTGSNITKITMP